MPIESNSIRNQPALTTSTGRIWLIMGGLFAAVSLLVLVPMTQLPPPGVALGAVIAIVVLYLVMVVVRYTVPTGRRRLAVLSIGMLAIAAVALVATGIVAASTTTV